MKKLFFTLVFLFLIYFGLQAAFYFLGPGHNTSYLINEYIVKEEYINKQEKENQAYVFNINDGNSNFYFQIFKNYDNQKNIIKEIKSYKKNDITCIMPILIDNKAATDLMCLKNNIVYNYNDLKNSDIEIDEFYQSLNDYLPKEDLSNQENRNTITIYKNNMQPNYYFSLATYKGYIYVNPTDKKINARNIFVNDVYDNYLSSYIDKYYVTVNYDEQYGYSNIYIANITNGKEETVILSKNIERNSYIQGIYKNSLYIFDRSNKIQYEIDTDSNTVLEVGNTSTGVKIYKNGTFERVSAYECANKDILFEDDKSSETEYKYLKSTLGKKTGYTYYYKKVGEQYQIYRANNIEKNQYMYLFTTKYIDKVITLNEYVYYLDDSYIKYYSDSTGIRTLLYNSELNFNQNIKYQIVYLK